MSNEMTGWEKREQDRWITGNWEGDPYWNRDPDIDAMIRAHDGMDEWMEHQHDGETYEHATCAGKGCATCEAEGVLYYFAGTWYPHSKYTELLTAYQNPSNPEEEPEPLEPDPVLCQMCEAREVKVWYAGGKFCWECYIGNG